MKANEAPENIYVIEQKAARGTIILASAELNDFAEQNNAKEYTRTDAFIDKALAYLNSKFYFNNVFYGIVSTDFNSMEEMYEDFRKHMEGE